MTLRKSTQITLRNRKCVRGSLCGRLELNYGSALCAVLAKENACANQPSQNQALGSYSIRMTGPQGTNMPNSEEELRRIASEIEACTRCPLS